MNRWLYSLLLLVLAGCARTPSREEVLRALIERQLRPDMQALASKATTLSLAARELCGVDAVRALKQSQAAWLDAMLAWERVYAFRLGPLVENSALLRARFWPVREASLQALLTSQSPLEQALLEQLGVDVRGMYALEWLLFGAVSTRLDRGDPSCARARELALALAENAQGYAVRSLGQLGDGAALVRQLSRDPQEVISRLVNQMIATVETLASDRLAAVLEMQTHEDLRLREVQGAASASSRELVQAQLVATEDMYRGRDGASLASLVAPVAAEIDGHVRARFKRAREALAQLDTPLERAVVEERPKVEAAQRALKELELALKVDLVSALGVTLTFSAGDGD